METADPKAPKVWRLATSESICNDANPSFNWDASLLIDSLDVEDVDGTRQQFVLLKVFDDDFGAEALSDLLGLVKIPITEISDRPLHKMKRRPLLVGLTDNTHVGHIQIGWQFVSLLNGKVPEVPFTHFPATHGNLVDLYHDAHKVSRIPSVPLEGDDEYQSRGCWRDMYYAINHAEDIIFIVGWSVNVHISLKRSKSKTYETVGEMLLKKAEEGVKVCVLVWDDFSSGKVAQEGFMGTSDEITYQYFKGTRVMCKRVPRETTGTGWLAQTFHKALFTHHQKVVVCDVENEGTNSRTLQAFFGGLDITNGRYDTPDHALFQNLDDIWKNDFYNGCVAAAGPDSGPREPWHDVHAVVKGAAAWQFLQNFQERCARQAPDMVSTVTEHVNGLEACKRVEKTSYSDCCAFSVQCLRSIDYASCVFHKSPLTNQYSQLNVVDVSIQQAYVYQIARAKRFVYIENQYFLGSSQMWIPNALQTVPCNNLVPQALTHRICEAIKHREDFHVYINIPLFPESIPEQAAPQEIMHYQYQTIRAMHRRINDYLKAEGVNGTAHDYMSLFFLGKREPWEEGMPKTEDVENSRADAKIKMTEKLRSILRTRRHQIYIHSKLLIVDDEYLLLGSANINERSMNGKRDSEIAGGVWQPDFRAKFVGDQIVLPKGYVYGFRKALFMEHLESAIEPSEFDDLGDPATVKHIRHLAEMNFDVFIGGEVRPLPNGHLCTYPYVTEGDDLTHHPFVEFIPDTKAKLLGATSTIMVDMLTT
ncbi:MAG: uncharacterized protein KVP18_000169 [Porospora cf. gigantea A]|uniref:uncharacterized protein n=1 Tax=Porospora cf. gigantea A TaxID=2853593 RepID=UPI003559A81E|nr:MAG: hypothetical protein KVP18_000169 [Porospora cf. gigantea A]